MPAGTYHFVLDCIVVSAVDVSFKLMVENAGNIVVLAEWSKHFDPLSTGYDAQAYAVDKQAPAIKFTPGDQLVLRYSASSSSKADAWIPNGDGQLSHGRIPNLTLP